MTKRKILIIEDEYDLAQMIKKYLEREQYQVAVTPNGNDGLTNITSFAPDMILLDIMLPGMDGLEILRQVRLKSSVPVIIISAKETEMDRVLGLKLGSDDYLTKPFSLKELVARVEAIFRRTAGALEIPKENEVLRYNDYRIDLLAREVYCENQPIPLTTKEFDVYVFLMQHSRQALSKVQIYQRVWGYEEYGDMNTVTIHIQKIREKLGPSHEITTIRGIGYRFDGRIK